MFFQPRNLQSRTRNLLALLIALCFTYSAHAQTKLLRFPDVHGDKVVFTYGGDLWLAATSGGAATRLTAHPGLELFAKFSPDGKWIEIGRASCRERVLMAVVAGARQIQKQFSTSSWMMHE